jgi:4-amino-4-deoxy-L-arabinose transferase-like glycosyltransferase
LKRLWWLGRLAATLVGAGMLVLIADHRNPWEMTRFTVENGTIHVRLFATTFSLPTWWTLYGALGAVLVTWLVVARRERPGLVSTTLGMLLVFSLAPIKPRAVGVVLNLLLGGLGTVLLVFGLAHPRVTAGAEASCRWAYHQLARLPRGAFGVSVFLFVFIVCLLGSHFVLGRIPHVVDAVDQLFHARILLSGATWAPAPEPGDFFQITHMIREGGRWYSQYPPGHSVLLALGLVARAPWMVNPLFAALSVLLLYGIGREIYDEKTARWAALCGAVSPFVWIQGSSFMNHTTTMFFFCLFLFGYARLERRGRPIDAGLAGLALGCGLSIRPWTTAALAAPFAVHALVRLIRPQPAAASAVSRPRFALCCVVLLLLLAIPLGGLLAFNQSTNGDPLLFGYQASHGTNTLPGFGHTGSEGRTRVHTPYWGLVYTLNNLNALNQYLFGWPLPSLLLPLIGLIVVRRSSWDVLLLASVGCLLLAYFTYWYHDWAYGPRFLYSAVAPLALLSGRALAGIPGALERRCGRRALGRLCLLFLLLFGYAWAVNVPLLAAFFSRDYYGTSAAVAAAVAREETAGSVVLVPGLYYASVFARNSPSLDGPVVYAWDLGQTANRAILERFPDRPFYKLRSLGRYALLPHRPGEQHGPPVYDVVPGAPLTVEALTFQVSHLAGGPGRNRKTSEVGGGWMNHDELWVSAASPGAEVGFILAAALSARRSLTVAMTMSPDAGIVEVLLNGDSLRRIDLYAPSSAVRSFPVGDVSLWAGRNGLTFRLVGKHQRSKGFGMGLDYFRLD